MALATSASAAPSSEPWTGFHVGVGVGANIVNVKDHSKGRSSASNNNNFTSSSGESWSDMGKTGAFGSIEGGYDWQMNKVVVGAFANYDFGTTTVSRTARSNVHSSNNNNNNTSNGFGTFKSTVRVGDSWAVGGRLGYLTSDKVLVYGVAGVAEADIRQTLTNSGVGYLTVSETSTHSTDKAGYFVGAGIEVKLNEHYSVKGEYRYDDYGTVHNDRGSLTGDYLRQDSSVTDNSLRAVLSYRF